MDGRIQELNIIAGKIDRHVNAAVDRWRTLPEKILAFRPSRDAWSTKEIIGHLIDSASNNHQRFVRLQILKELTFPDYGQDNIRWIRIQNYQERNWEELLDLWRYFNIQLAHIIRSVDSDSLNHIWQLEGKAGVTLFDLMIDYLRHLEDHLHQISNTIEAFDGC